MFSEHLQTLAMWACAWLRGRTIAFGAAFGLPVHAHFACCSAQWRRGHPAMDLGRQYALSCVLERSKWVRVRSSELCAKSGL